jgi:hypothetical protein
MDDAYIFCSYEAFSIKSHSLFTSLGAHHENCVSIRCHLQNGIHVVHPLQGQTSGSKRVPDLGCEQDEEEQSISFLQLPHMCASWCEARCC